MATVVNDAHLFSVKRMIDLSRLNEAERRVLRLLAEGHTAKSIATELGTSPNWLAGWCWSFIVDAHTPAGRQAGQQVHGEPGCDVRLEAKFEAAGPVG